MRGKFGAFLLADAGAPLGWPVRATCRATKGPVMTATPATITTDASSPLRTRSTVRGKQGKWRHPRRRGTRRRSCSRRPADARCRPRPCASCARCASSACHHKTAAPNPVNASGHSNSPADPRPSDWTARDAADSERSDRDVLAAPVESLDTVSAAALGCGGTKTQNAAYMASPAPAAKVSTTKARRTTSTLTRRWSASPRATPATSWPWVAA